MHHVKMFLTRADIGFFNKKLTTMRCNEYFIALLKGHRAVALISNDSNDFKRRRIKAKKAQLKRKITRVLTKRGSVQQRFCRVYGTNFDRKITPKSRGKRNQATRRIRVQKTVDILLERENIKLKNRRSEAAIAGNLSPTESWRELHENTSKFRKEKPKTAVLPSNFYGRLTSIGDRHLPDKRARKFHPERSRFFRKTLIFWRERKISKQTTFLSTYFKWLQRKVVKNSNSRPRTQQRLATLQSKSQETPQSSVNFQKRVKSNSVVVEKYQIQGKLEEGRARQKADYEEQKVTEKSKRVKGGLKKVSYLNAVKNNKENFDLSALNLKESITKDYGLIDDHFCGGNVQSNYLITIKEGQSVAEPDFLATVGDTALRKRGNSVFKPEKLQQEQNNSKNKSESENRKKETLLNWKQTNFCSKNKQNSGIFINNDKGVQNRGQKREQDKKKAQFRGRSRINSVKLSSLHWILMANFVWWCFDTTNCVQVQQNEQTCPTDCDCYNDLKVVYFLLFFNFYSSTVFTCSICCYIIIRNWNESNLLQILYTDVNCDSELGRVTTLSLGIIETSNARFSFFSINPLLEHSPR